MPASSSAAFAKPRVLPLPLPTVADSTLREAVTIGQTPGAPVLGIPAQAGTTSVIEADLQREYVSGAGIDWFAHLVRTLGFPIDDLESELGTTIYEKMSKDPQAAAALRVLKGGILANGLELSSAVDDESEPDFALAEEIKLHCERNFEQLRTPAPVLWWEYLDALHLGYRIGELVYREGDGPDTDRLMLQDIKIKPTRSAAFVVDPFWNVIGIAGLLPGLGMPVQQMLLISDPAKVGNIYPRHKFAVLTMNSREHDPRGNSVFRSAYTPWNAKMQIWGEYMRFLAQWANPPIIGITPPNAASQAVKDANGKPTAVIRTAQEAMTATLMKFRNALAASFPAGSDFREIGVQRTGDPILSAFDLCDRQMAKGILGQTLATEEGKHQTRASSEVHMDILGLQIMVYRTTLAAMVRQDILRRQVVINWGEARARLTPKASFGKVEKQDIASALDAATKAGYRFSSSQLPGVDRWLGFEARSQKDLEELQAAPDVTPTTPAPPDPAQRPSRPALTRPVAPTPVASER